MRRDLQRCRPRYHLRFRRFVKHNESPGRDAPDGPGHPARLFVLPSCLTSGRPAHPPKDMEFRPSASERRPQQPLQEQGMYQIWKAAAPLGTTL